MPDWKPTLGALASSDGTTFRVWAPERQSVEVVCDATGGGRPLAHEADGFWSATFTDVRAGALYKYRLDGRNDLVFPDPASRFQPCGVHGASQVVDPSVFRWTDATWIPRSLDETIFYELHIGTFTPEGTFRAAIDRLPYLTRLGVTAIEIMPVGDFPGERNWGYDGVAIFAPARCYGTPDDLRELVDAAHAHGLAVYLDVVYNHLGPDGAYANVFSPYYFSSAHSSPWGAGVNLDRPHSAAVRRLFIENALHWVSEYHIDGLRLDATHALVDDGATHFLAELTTTVRANVDRPVTFVAEDHRNLSLMLQPVDSGGWGIDGVWADDFHHELRVHTAGDREGYFSDYSGCVRDLVTTLRQGWFYSGQASAHLQTMRGTDPSAIAPQQFVICIQNHDQIGNRADGARLHHQIESAVYRALSAVLLFAPQTPLLFMGQEWSAATPFLFFTDHHDELGRQVTAGRREEFKSFAAFSDPVDRERIPDPQSVETFERSRLVWNELEQAPHAGVLELYERLIALRRGLAPARHGTYTVDQIDDHTFTVSRFDRQGKPVVLVARISGGAADVPLPLDSPPHVLLTTGGVTLETAPSSVLRFTRPGAIVLGSSLSRGHK